MTPFTEFQFCVALQEERLPKERLTLVQLQRPQLSHRLCLRFGSWLTRGGNWLMKQGQYQTDAVKDLELV